MFIYIADSRPFLTFYTPFRVTHNVWKLHHNLNDSFNLGLQVKINFSHFKPEVELVNPNYPEFVDDNYAPEFSFKVSKKNQGIFLNCLRLPPELQHRGIGTYCVRWLKNFAKRFGFNYIVLGSYPEAEKFWSRMGFAWISKTEYWKYFPVW